LSLWTELSWEKRGGGKTINRRGGCEGVFSGLRGGNGAYFHAYLVIFLFGAVTLPNQRGGGVVAEYLFFLSFFSLPICINFA